MKNSREEDIKMIEILKNKNLYINIKPKSSICIDCINKNKNKHIEAEVVINEKLEEAINYTLSDYKRVLKENEELKFKERRRIIGKYGEVEIHDVINRTLSNDYISVKKIKDKIEKEIKYHEKNILDIENITMLKGKTAKEEAEIEFNKYAIVVLKKMLQELLEGRK